MQALTSNLLNNMTYISVAIIVAMVAIFIIGVVNNLILKSSYSKIIKELDLVNNDGMEVYNNKLLNEIISAYKDAYLKSYDGVNTQAVIESNFYKMGKSKLGKESFLNNLNTMLLTLGVVGTLYNIIVIVMNLAQMFKGVDAHEIVSMTSVLGDVSTIIGYMAIAFASTFIAIVLSFIYSVINSITHIESERTNLFSRLEDYLDNTLGANLSKNKPKMLPQEGYSNANILYTIKNTSDSMMKTTAQLEQTIAKLNSSLKGMIEEKTQTSFLPNRSFGQVDELYSEDPDEFEGYEQLRLERLKQVEELKKDIEQRAAEKIDNLKNIDAIPNKDKVYVKEVEVTKDEILETAKNIQTSNEKITDVQKSNLIENASNNIPMPTMVDTDDTPMPSIPTDEEMIKQLDDHQKEIISDAERKFFDEHKASDVLPRMQNDHYENLYTTDELNNSIKIEERKLDTILNEEENRNSFKESINIVPEIKSNVVVESPQARDAIKALTAEDIEALKRELVRRQEEERRIKEILNNTNH